MIIWQISEALHQYKTFGLLCSDFLQILIYNIKQTRLLIMKEVEFYSKLITPTKQVNVRLESKKMPLISVNQDENIIKYIRPGNENQISAARTQQPLQIHTTAAYFQAEILGLRRRSDIGIGLINKDCALKKHPGASKFSVGYISDGQILFHRSKIANAPHYTKNDRIGVGVDYSLKEIFFTKNGELIKHKVTGIDNINWIQFYPCVSVHNQGDEVKLIFQESQFKFDFKSYRKKLQNQMFQQIKAQKHDLGDVYALVSDYLSFNGYSKTLQELQKAKKTEIKTEFMHHPYYENKIAFKNTARQMEMIDQQNQHEKGADQDQEIIQNRQSAKRHRIMSDFWVYMVPDQLPRKYTIQEEKLLIDSRRKSSIVSNIQSNIKEMGEQANDRNIITNESMTNFLSSTRLKILNLIRTEQIQDAMAVMFNSIPQIFTIYENLEIIFKMQIFLRKIKRQGSKEAILYARQVSQQFLKAKSLLFPKFNRNQGKMQFVPFTEMMGCLRFQKDEKYDALSSQQFEYFGLYINELILKSLGLYSESRLSLMLNHMKNLEHKSKQHQITGPLFTTKL